MENFPPANKTSVIVRTLQHRPATLIAAIFTFCMLTGCAAFNGTRLEGLLGTHHDLVKLAYTIAEDLETRAYPPLILRNSEKPILTTTFVNINDLEETSPFSRIVQEHLTSRLVQMGYAVREIKFRESLNIEPRQGERMLSRNLKHIQTSQTAQAIAVGTYSLTNNKIYVSARMVDPENNTIISSSDYSLRVTDDLLATFGIHKSHQESMVPIEEPRPSLMTRILY